MRVWIRRYLLCEDDRAEFVSKHLFQHGHQLLVVQVLHAVEVIKVQEHHLPGMSRQEATDLLQTRSHLNKTQESEMRGRSWVLRDKNKRKNRQGFLLFQGSSKSFVFYAAFTPVQVINAKLFQIYKNCGWILALQLCCFSWSVEIHKTQLTFLFTRIMFKTIKDLRKNGALILDYR